MNIMREIPYQRDKKAGFVLGALFAVVFYGLVPMLGTEDLQPVTFALLVIDSFYAILGFLKYLTKSNEPKCGIVLDLVLNYVYLWRRSV